MKKNQKTRLCWNCEGRVALDEENCHLCGVSVVPASLDPSARLFNPPYQFDNPSETSINSRGSSSSQDYVDSSENDADNSEESSMSSFNRALLSLVFLLTGAAFFIFGLSLMIFSHNGVFTLQWDGSLWFIYSGLSIPLLICGWMAMSKLDN